MNWHAQGSCATKNMAAFPAAIQKEYLQEKPKLQNYSAESYSWQKYTIVLEVYSANKQRHSSWPTFCGHSRPSPSNKIHDPLLMIARRKYTLCQVELFTIASPTSSVFSTTTSGPNNTGYDGKQHIKCFKRRLCDVDVPAVFRVCPADHFSACDGRCLLCKCRGEQQGIT